LDAAFGRESGQRLPNPFSPAMIAQALHSAIHAFRLTAAVERLVFKVFQEVVLNNLGRLYKGLNNTLIKHGVLPDLDVTRYLASEALKRNRAVSSAPTKNVAAQTAA